MISNQVSPLAKAIFRIDDVAGLLQSGEKYYMQIDEVGAGVFLGPDFIVSLTQHNTTQHNDIFSPFRIFFCSPSTMNYFVQTVTKRSDDQYWGPLKV
jgi:hypothetical protein